MKPNLPATAENEDDCKCYHPAYVQHYKRFRSPVHGRAFVDGENTATEEYDTEFHEAHGKTLQQLKSEFDLDKIVLTQTGLDDTGSVTYLGLDLI
jgi:hypothetical protein